MNPTQSSTIDEAKNEVFLSSISLSRSLILAPEQKSTSFGLWNYAGRMLRVETGRSVNEVSENFQFKILKIFNLLSLNPAPLRPTLLTLVISRC